MLPKCVLQPLKSLRHLAELPQTHKLPNLTFVRYKPFPKLLKLTEAVSSPITDSYSLTRYNTPPLKFSQAIDALRAYSLVDTDECVTLNLDLNLFDSEKKKQVVQIVSSVILFPYQFTDEASVFVLCGNDEVQFAKDSGANGYLEERSFHKLESMGVTHDYYIATLSIADTLRSQGFGKVLRHKIPNRRRGTIVNPEMLKESVHRFLATTTLKFDKLPTDKTRAELKMDFGKLSFTNEMLLENLDEIMNKLKDYKVPRLETFILGASVSTEYGPTYVLSEEIYMRVNKHTPDTTGLF